MQTRPPALYYIMAAITAYAYDSKRRPNSSYCTSSAIVFPFGCDRNGLLDQTRFVKFLAVKYQSSHTAHMQTQNLLFQVTKIIVLVVLQEEMNWCLMDYLEPNCWLFTVAAKFGPLKLACVWPPLQTCKLWSRRPYHMQFLALHQRRHDHSQEDMLGLMM